MQMVEHQVIYSPVWKNKSLIRALRVTSSILFYTGSKKSPYSVGRWSSFITSGMDSSLSLLIVSPSLLGLNWLFLLGLGRLGTFFPSSCKAVPGSFGSRQLPAFLSGTEIISCFLSCVIETICNFLSCAIKIFHYIFSCLRWNYSLLFFLVLLKLFVNYSLIAVLHKK